MTLVENQGQQFNDLGYSSYNKDLLESRKYMPRCQWDQIESKNPYDWMTLRPDKRFNNYKDRFDFIKNSYTPVSRESDTLEVKNFSYCNRDITWERIEVKFDGPASGAASKDKNVPFDVRYRNIRVGPLSGKETEYAKPPLGYSFGNVLGIVNTAMRVIGYFFPIGFIDVCSGIYDLWMVFHKKEMGVYCSGEIYYRRNPDIEFFEDNEEYPLPERITVIHSKSVDAVLAPGEAKKVALRATVLIIRGLLGTVMLGWLFIPLDLTYEFVRIFRDSKMDRITVLVPEPLGVFNLEYCE